MLELLVIDDDPVFTDALRRTLGRAGYRVCCAATAVAALDLARARRPSQVVVDLNLGGESGLALIEELRATLPEAGIVILTGYASIATAVTAMRLGADDYLPKPLDRRALLRALAGESATATLHEQPLSPKRLEWEHIQRVLAEHQGNVSATARALGMHRRTLQRKLGKRPVSG